MTDTLAEHKKVARVSALFFMSMLVGCDVLLEVFCARFPLMFYVVAALIGYWVGTKMAAWITGEGGGKKILRILVTIVCIGGLFGTIALSTLTPLWGSKCGWRYCARALGPSPMRSPFPVGTPSCGNLHMCANEFPYTPAERPYFDALIERHDCPPP